MLCKNPLSGGQGVSVMLLVHLSTVVLSTKQPVDEHASMGSGKLSSAKVRGSPRAIGGPPWLAPCSRITDTYRDLYRHLSPPTVLKGWEGGRRKSIGACC